MKSISKQAITIALLAVAIFAVPGGNSAIAAKSNCKSVNKTYPFGIALNKQSIGTSRAEINRTKYIQLKYLDKDLDGIVCEIEKLQASIVSTTPVTTSSISSAVSYPGFLEIERYQTQGGIPQQSNSVYKKCASGSSNGLNASLTGCPTTNLLTHITGSFRIDFGITGSEHYIWFYSSSKDGIVVNVNGQKIIDQWTTRPYSDIKVLGGYFRSGEKYPIEIWSFNSDGLPKNALWFGVDGLNWTTFSNNADCTIGCRINLFGEIAPISSYWSTSTASVPKAIGTTITLPTTNTSTTTLPVTRKVCVSGGSCSLGDLGPGGGIVFYNAGSPQSWGQYLEAAQSDLGKFQWNDALNAAKAYRGGGVTDWRLPTKDELNSLYLQKGVVGGFAYFYYWSSTANSATGSWQQRISNGEQSSYNIGAFNGVRPVRAF